MYYKNEVFLVWVVAAYAPIRVKTTPKCSLCHNRYKISSRLVNIWEKADQKNLFLPYNTGSHAHQAWTSTSATAGYFSE